MKHLALIGLFALSACGGGGSPSAPTPPAIAQVGGLWGWIGTQTSASGGECVGAFEATQTGSRGTGTITITQSGSGLTARSTADSDGSVCDYTGTAGINSVVLNGTACSPSVRLFLCANGFRRDVIISTLAVNATLNGSVLTGTSVAVYNVVVSGSGAPIALMTLNAAYTATRR